MNDRRVCVCVCVFAGLVVRAGLVFLAELVGQALPQAPRVGFRFLHCQNRENALFIASGRGQTLAIF